MRILKLNSNNIDEAVMLLQRVFPDDKEDCRKAFESSLDIRSNPDWIRKYKIKNIEYWVMMKDDEVIGTVGLYNETSDPEKLVWLGWYCVKKSYRGQGIGKRLFIFARNKAKKRGNKILRLYTSPKNKIANKMYDNIGFKVVKVIGSNTKDILFHKEIRI